MYKKIFLLLIILCLSITEISAQLIKLSHPNLKTEAEILVNESGNWYSNTLRVHFAEKTVDLKRNEKFASLSKVLIPEVQNLLSTIEKKHGKIILQKVFTNSQWGDTIGIHIVTKEKVKLKDLSQFYKIVFDHTICVDSLIMQLKGSKYFISVERPVGAISTYEPNDYSASEQWALPKMEATKAWDITRGSSSIKIGINDYFSSYDINNLHNELRSNKVVYNPNNLCLEHGQIVAGCASALTDNGTGIAGIGFNTSLMFTLWTESGIDLLRVNGAHIINCSWIWSDYDALSTAIYNCLNTGVIVTAAVGNNVANVGYIPRITYPAAYNFSSIGKQVIAISATHLISGSEVFGYPPDGRWNYSPGTDPIGNPTTGFVDFSAPGVFIKCLDDTTTNAYITASGTSMA
ncbi:MAG: S8 family serine peptidase, partial [Melioribacteraceae bacterium]